MWIHISFLRTLRARIAAEAVFQLQIHLRAERVFGHRSNTTQSWWKIAPCD